MRHTHKADGRPSFQFYPDDWLNDLALGQCSMAAQGLWMHMLCRMWTSPKRGYLLKANGSKAEANHIAKWASISEAEAKQLVSELQAEGVCSTNAESVIYNRRMARDEKQRLSKVEAGRKGGMVSKTQAEPQAKRGPSTSSSSSTSTSTTKNNKEQDPSLGQKPPAPKKKVLKKNSGDHAVFIDYFCQQWHDRFGKPYSFAKGKDGASVKAMLEVCCLEELKDLTDTYLGLEDKFIAENGYSISIMRHKLNALRVHPLGVQRKYSSVNELRTMLGWPIPEGEEDQW